MSSRKGKNRKGGRKNQNPKETRPTFKSAKDLSEIVLSLGDETFVYVQSTRTRTTAESSASDEEKSTDLPENPYSDQTSADIGIAQQKKFDAMKQDLSIALNIEMKKIANDIIEKANKVRSSTILWVVALVITIIAAFGFIVDIMIENAILKERENEPNIITQEKPKQAPLRTDSLKKPNTRLNLKNHGKQKP